MPCPFAEVSSIRPSMVAQGHSGGPVSSWSRKSCNLRISCCPNVS